MRALAFLSLTLGLLWSLEARGQDAEGWELWRSPAAGGDAQATPSAGPAAAEPAAPAPGDGGATGAEVGAGASAAVVAPAGETEHFLHFGAGASFLAPVRVGDLAHGDRWLAEVSFRWAPFGLTGEIGLDFALGKDNVLLFRPNLKFFFVKGWIFSMFLDGGCAVLSHPGGTEVGGSTSLGLVFGVHENVAIELAGTVSLFGMTDRASAAFAGGPPVPEGGERRLVVFPGAVARLLARF